MKNTLIAFASAALLAAPASAQNVRVGTDVTNISRDAEASLRVEVNNLQVGTLPVEFGVAGRTDFGNGTDELNARAGYNLQLGNVTLTPNASVGVTDINDDGRPAFGTFGVGADGRFQMGPRLAFVGSYVYRQAFDGSDRYRLNEYTAGGEVTLTDRVAVDARYFRRTGTRDFDGVLVGTTIRF